MYQCECGHKFRRPLDLGEEHSESSVCPSCKNDRYVDMAKSASEMMCKCETLIAVWEDFYHNWDMMMDFTAKQRIDRHVARLNRMRDYYLTKI